MSDVQVKVKRGKVVMPDYDSFASPDEAFQYIVAAENKRDELKQEKSIKQKMRMEKDCRYYESLKTAYTHEQRLGLLHDMSLEALKKIALSEHINVKGLRSKKDIVDTLLRVIEGRYDTLDKGEHVYIPDEFGLPVCGDDTPLNAARIHFNKKAVRNIQHAINQDLKAQAITVEAVEKPQHETHETNALPEKISGTDEVTFSFSYTADKKKYSVTFSVQDCPVSEAVPDGNVSDWQTKYFNRFIMFLNPDGKRCFVYYPFLDYVEFQRGFSQYCKWQNSGSRERACEAQLRKVLPNILKHFGYLDDNGVFIPDGNEAYRALLYKTFKEGNIQYATDFVMPDNPFSNDNDKDNPLSWPDCPQRTQALRLFHRLLYTQHFILNSRCHNDADRKARNKEIESIRKIIHSLFEAIKQPQNNSQETQEISYSEAWLKTAQDLGYSWSREQFIKGCLIQKEYDAYKHSLELKHESYAVMSASLWLRTKYATSLKALQHIAAFFGIETPDDKTHKRAIEKRDNLAHQLADLIFCDMACVYVRTYVTVNPPALPPELSDTPNHKPVLDVTSNRKHSNSPRERNIVTAQDISACGCQNQILALLEPLKLTDLKSLAKELGISLVNLKHMNTKKRLAHYIAYKVIVLRNIQQKKNNTLPTESGKRLTTLQNFSIAVDTQTGQLSFSFA